MITRPFRVLAVVACMIAIPAFAHDSADKQSASVADSVCTSLAVEKRVYPHPHKGLIVKRSVNAENECTAAERKVYDSSI